MTSVPRRFVAISRASFPSIRVAALRALSLVITTTFAACTSSTGPSGGGTGSLSVTISQPTGISPTVTVTGPAGYSKTLTASETLSGLAAGTYAVTAGTAVTADSIVSVAYAGTVTGSPAAVTAHETAAATVTYAQPWASSGVLWVANQIGNNVTGFSSTQLRSTGAPVPKVAIGNGTGTSTVQNATALAVDRSGGLWIADGTDTLYYYAASQITANTNAAASVKLVSTTLHTPSAIAFDGQGNLWVADQAIGKISAFSPSQLASGGSVTPPIILSSSLGSINRPFAIAFDSHGDLWVANYGDSTVVGFSPSQLQASGGPIPFAGLSGAPGTSNCLGIAFDSQGNLWVSTLTDTLSEFTPSQLTSIGAPTPVVRITTPSFQFAEGMAFDNSGALWMADNQGAKLIRYVASQLTTGGSKTPAVTISATSHSIDLPGGIVFSPHAPALPVN